MKLTQEQCMGESYIGCYLAKIVIRKCFTCKRFHTKPFTKQQQCILPSDRTTGIRPFLGTGTDFAGPIMHRNKNRVEEKPYILLFTCGLTRAIHLELLPDQAADEFKRALNRLIARRRFPE